MHEHHHHTVNAESEEELKVLVEYMVKHNISHTDELCQIAERLKKDGKNTSAEKTLEAINVYNKGNALLKEVLETL
ncbi:MAG: hypothetical protein IJR70_02435 [Eubacterium sp.]|nr:hypothetical protein [Eubacterium sp.]